MSGAIFNRGILRNLWLASKYDMSNWMRMVACILLLALVVPAWTPAGSNAADSATSPAFYFLAITRKTGVFSFAAHDHAVLAKESSVNVSLHEDLARSSVTLTVPVAMLVIDSEQGRRLAGLGAGPSASDVAKIQQTMLGPAVLDASRYPTITFTSTSVEKRGDGVLRLVGNLSLHGRQRKLDILVQYQKAKNGSFVFSGAFTIRQTDFGIRPQKVGLGTVKVKDEMEIRFRASVMPGGGMQATASRHPRSEIPRRSSAGRFRAIQKSSPGTRGQRNGTLRNQS